MGISTKQDIITLYRKRAKRYNLSARLYYLVGFRDLAYRKKAVKALNLQLGDTVVEIGCGTGLNFPLLQKAVGPEGKIIGVDLTDAMLTQARKQIDDRGWSNVELVQSDARSYQFPQHVDGVISTFAMMLMPEYDQIVKNGAAALAAGKRFVILDLKEPANLPGWLVNFGVLISSPFGVSLDLVERHPWESMEKYLTNISFRELFFGFSYIASGEDAREG